MSRVAVRLALVSALALGGSAPCAARVTLRCAARVASRPALPPIAPRRAWRAARMSSSQPPQSTASSPATSTPAPTSNAGARSGDRGTGEKPMWQNIWTPFSLLPILLLWLWPWFLDMVITSPVGHRLGIGHLAASSRILHLHEQLDTLKRISGRLLVASGCGAIIGLERKDADRPAGLRSMTLVSSGSALYTLACIYGIDKGDPARAAAQVCTGVGFIGAGVIAKGSGRDPVRGITTACAVWVSAALGVVAASGLWLFAFYACGLTVTVLRVSRLYKAFMHRDLFPHHHDDDDH